MSDAAATALGSEPPATKVAQVQAALGRAKAQAVGVLANARPWAELADRSAFSKPADVAEVRGGERERACRDGQRSRRKRDARRICRCPSPAPTPRLEHTLHPCARHRVPEASPPASRARAGIAGPGTGRPLGLKAATNARGRSGVASQPSSPFSRPPPASARTRPTSASTTPPPPRAPRPWPLSSTRARSPSWPPWARGGRTFSASGPRPS